MVKVKEINRRCPMCGKAHHVYLFGDEVYGYVSYVVYDRYVVHARKTIQESLPDTEVDVREFIKTGYCNKCQKKIFYSKKDSKRIKEGYADYLELLDIDEVESKEALEEYIADIEALRKSIPSDTAYSIELESEFDGADQTLIRKERHVVAFQWK